MTDQPKPQNPLTHFDESGRAQMVDVGCKPETERVAEARGTIRLSTEVFQLISKGHITKGDVLGVARIAGIMAAKKTPELIPLAHPLQINRVAIDFEHQEGECSIDIIATVATTGRTGVEMEALTAVSVTALTIYDMCKSLDKNMIIDRIMLTRKSGGKSGPFTREPVLK
ncbi:MAG: cyclic pyranopterin monophosphate synthase MoaC [Proteobacteria bacterium]|nr:cyclic pyranopterin monophosphate synthase MoaC [Pseudomonadota bacterium]MBU1688376.1 cyclic pyranopterin monophosphate synthase MoaC [Pseudomonadota bacterium]